MYLRERWFLCIRLVEMWYAGSSSCFFSIFMVVLIGSVAGHGEAAVLYEFALPLEMETNTT